MKTDTLIGPITENFEVRHIAIWGWESDRLELKIKGRIKNEDNKLYGVR